MNRSVCSSCPFCVCAVLQGLEIMFGILFGGALCKHEVRWLWNREKRQWLFFVWLLMHHLFKKQSNNYITQLYCFFRETMTCSVMYLKNECQQFSFINTIKYFARAFQFSHTKFNFHLLCTGNLECILITAKKRSIHLNCHFLSPEVFQVILTYAELHSLNTKDKCF